MAEPRKIFRIQERAASAVDAQPGEAPPQLAEIMNELAVLRSMLSATPGGPMPQLSPAGEMDRLAAKLRLIRSGISGAGSESTNAARGPSDAATRIADELGAVIKGCEQATEKILVAAEDIDQAANNLSAALKDGTEQGLAHDIRDRVIAIFEACNYQDLISQRVAKVLTALGRVEQQIAHALDDMAREAAPPMYGPRLEGDRGHVSQSDINSMFRSGALPV